MHNLFRLSECKGKYLHRFNIIGEYPDGVLEVCEICHKTRFFKLIDGKADNLSYMNWHIRSALYPQHPYYFHEHLYDPELIESIYE